MPSFFMRRAGYKEVLDGVSPPHLLKSFKSLLKSFKSLLKFLKSYYNPN